MNATLRRLGYLAIVRILAMFSLAVAIIISAEPASATKRCCGILLDVNCVSRRNNETRHLKDEMARLKDETARLQNEAAKLRSETAHLREQIANAVAASCKSHELMPKSDVKEPTPKGDLLTPALQKSEIHKSPPDKKNEARAFSSEVDTDSREENATKQKDKAPFQFNQNGKSSTLAGEQAIDRHKNVMERAWKQLIDLAARMKKNPLGGSE